MSQDAVIEEFELWQGKNRSRLSIDDGATLTENPEHWEGRNRSPLITRDPDDPKDPDDQRADRTAGAIATVSLCLLVVMVLSDG